MSYMPWKRQLLDAVKASQNTRRNEDNETALFYTTENQQNKIRTEGAAEDPEGYGP